MTVPLQLMISNVFVSKLFSHQVELLVQVIENKISNLSIPDSWPSYDPFFLLSYKNHKIKPFKKSRERFLIFSSPGSQVLATVCLGAKGSSTLE